MYSPKPGEYVRPAAEYFLNYPHFESHDRHFVRGAFAHQDALDKVGVVSEQLMELVPEPGNPHDPWAVALHVRGDRIGYISSETAGSLHEYIVGHNRRGRAVVASGAISCNASGEFQAAVHLPWWRHQEDFRRESGVPKECEALLRAVPEDALLRIMINSQHLDEPDIETLWDLRRFAPTLIWPARSEAEMPVPLRFVLTDMDKKRKLDIREANAKQREAQKAEKHREKQAHEKERKMLNSAICGLASAGMTIAQIKVVLRCSEQIVRKAIQAAGITAFNTNMIARDKKLARGKVALRMQRAGETRGHIAAELGCSVDTVKDMLRDAKFFEDPASDLQRQQKAERVGVVSNFVKLEEAAKVLGWTVKAVKNARSDRQTLKDHPAEKFHD